MSEGSNKSGRPWDVAILGMGCRFPGARGFEAFAEALLGGRDAITEVPEDRWDAAAIYDPDLEEPMRSSTRWGGFIDDVSSFDARFFGIGDAEATAMDPQQRILLETTWEALEHANILPASLAGVRGGVWVAISHNEYSRRALSTPAGQNAFAAAGTELSMGANRISRHLGLSGPSIAVNTGCSSSLVALDAACRALAAREVDFAIVGGVSLMLEPEATIALSQAWMMAADGRCKAFDSSADGYVRSEGCGVVVLRRGSEAGNVPTLGRVRGSAVGYGSGSSVTAPNPRAQAAVMRRALRVAETKPESVGFIEGHGVGTAGGDAAEVAALREVYGAGSPAESSPCWLGSVKTNVGHLEWASGMPALARALVALRAGVVPPHLHLAETAPACSLEGTRLAIATEPVAWVASPHGADDPRVASVSSFGLGGTLAHVVLEQGVVPTKSDALDGSPGDVHILRVSADDPESFRALAERYRVALAEGHVSLRDLARTVADARTRFAYATHMAVRNEAEACAALSACQLTPPPRAPGAPKVGFLFTGQGSQFAGMGSALYASEPSFRALVDTLDPTTQAALTSADAVGVDATEVAQPALVAFELGLARVLATYGVRPDAVMGHSVGEYAAACVAEILDHEDTLTLVRERGRLMGTLPREGGMLAVMSSEADVVRRLLELGSTLSIAAENAPASVVCSGATGDLEALEAALEDDFVATQRLNVSHAFHSGKMDPILDAFELAASRATFRQGRVPLARNLDGRLVHELDASVCRAALRGTVRFVDGVRSLAAVGCTCFVEVGPTPTLAKAAKRSIEATAFLVAADPRDGRYALAATLAALANHGVDVDLAAYERERGGRLARIPTYAFRQTRFWIERPPAVAHLAASTAGPGSDLDELLALPPQLREGRVREIITNRIGALTHRDVDPRRSLFDLGLSSLALTELRADIARRFGAGAPSLADIFSHPTPEAVARFVARQLGFASPPSQVASPEGSPVDGDLVAIVGLSLRLPGGSVDLASYFETLSRAAPLASEAPEARRVGHSYRAAWLEDIANFDAAHFGISASEARVMDPQHRLLLEASWHALEDAGRAVDALEGSRTGVYFGLLGNEYVRLVEREKDQGAYALAGNLWSAAAGRVAHLLGLQGPALVVDTACSSSLVALDLAAKALCRGECDLALVGGASLFVSPDGFRALERVGATSPDGRSKAFEPAADGYGRGEGVVVMALSRLRDAHERGDRVLGVLLGSGVAHDGRAVSLTAPNGDSQQRLIETTLARAGLSPDDVDYVECHGTGTPLGDPIEVAALTRAFGRGRRSKPLLLGAAKAVVGHGEAVSGLIGVAKVLACFGQEEIPPQPPAPHHGPGHPPETAPLRVSVASNAWRRDPERRRVAGVSAFGMSGTNAHVVLAEPPIPQASDVLARPSTTPAVVAMSASSRKALRALTARFGLALEGAQVSLDAFANASRRRRTALPHRLAIVASTTVQASGAIQDWLAGVANGAVIDETSAEHATSSEMHRRARAWVLGRAGLEDGVEGPHVDLPLYPFDATPHWVASESDSATSIEPSNDAVEDAPVRVPASLGMSFVPFHQEESAGQRAFRCVSTLAWASDDVVEGDVAGGAALLYAPRGDSPARAVARIAALVRLLGRSEAPPSLVVVSGDVMTDITAAAVAGALRVVRHEHPELPIRLVSVGGAADQDAAIAALGPPDTLPPESRLANHVWSRPVVVGQSRTPVGRPLKPGEVAMLETLEPGFLDRVHLVARSRESRRAGEVRIRVESVALSFLDAMRATGLLEDECSDVREAHGLGCEVLGVVMEADDLAIGTRVVALSLNGAGSEVTLPRDWVVPCEGALSAMFGHALSEFVAHEVMSRVAPWLGPQHRVLIQSATGAVGRAIVHRSLERGATVFATAGDEKRRDALRALGIEHVFPSRDGSCAEGVLSATRREGVDLVISSSAGEGLANAVRALRDGGAVVDLNRRAATATQSVQSNRVVFRFDVMALARTRPERVREALLALRARALAGALPPTPRQSFDLAQVQRALRTLAHAEHDGKVTLTFSPSGEQHANVSRGASSSEISATALTWRARPGTHLITGGLGALGLKVAEWLVERGARSIALAGRRPPGEYARQVIEALEAKGARVAVHSVDVADAQEVSALVANHPDIVGTVHAAGSLDDGLVVAQSRSRVAPVLSAKLDSALLLDEHLPAGLDYFVMFGSVAGSLGNTGQLSYAAANAGLSALAHRRRARGEHGLCVDWGPWAASGMAADRAGRVAGNGARFLEAGVAFEMLERALLADATHTIELDADMPELVRALPALRTHVSELVAPFSDHGDRELLGALSSRTGGARLEHATKLVAELVHATQPTTSLVGADQVMALDSLAAVELRNRVRAQFGVSLAVGALQRTSPRALAQTLLEGLGLAERRQANEAARALVPLRRVSAPALRLVCFPFAGGGPSTYSEWAEALPPDIDLLSVELPGRGARYREQPLTRIADVVNGVLTELRAEADRPLVLFGHCMGALVAYEVARAATASGVRVDGLIASGCPGPAHYAVPSLCRATDRYDKAPATDHGEPDGWWPVHRHDDHELGDVLRFLGFGPSRALLADRDLRRAMLPTIRADFEVCASYVDTHRAPLELPVAVIAGDQDPFATPAEVARWRDVISGELDFSLLPGDHYFLFPEREAVLGVVRRMAAIVTQR